jgi:transmembrane sensor
MKPPFDSETPPVWRDRPLDWVGAAGGRDLLLEALERGRARRRARRRVALGAAAGVVAVLAAWVAWPARTVAPDGGAAVAARAQAQRELVVIAPARRTLADGSLVELRRDAEVTVAFASATADERRVALVRGQAHFQVAPDAARPFVVAAGAARFRAVGTAFAVALTDSGIELIVTEGRVAVEAAVAGAPPLALAAAGERVTLDAAGALRVAAAPAPAEEIEAQLGWRSPRIEFDETPLGEVVRALAQHGGHRIELADPALARLEITGALRAGNLAPLLTLLRKTHGIHAEPQPDGAVRLRRGTAGNGP